jgi:hypothetical protein
MSDSTKRIVLAQEAFGRALDAYRGKPREAVADVFKVPDDWPFRVDAEKAVAKCPLGLQSVQFLAPAREAAARRLLRMHATWVFCEGGHLWREWRLDPATPPDDDCGPCPICIKDAP